MLGVCNLYAQDAEPFYLQSGKYYNIEAMRASSGERLSPKDNPGNWLHYYQKNADEHILEIISFDINSPEKIVSQYVVFATMSPDDSDSVIYFFRDAKDYSFVDCCLIEDECIAIMRFWTHEPSEEKYFILGSNGWDYNKVKKMYTF